MRTGVRIAEAAGDPICGARCGPAILFQRLKATNPNAMVEVSGFAPARPHHDGAAKVEQRGSRLLVGDGTVRRDRDRCLQPAGPDLGGKPVLRVAKLRPVSEEAMASPCNSRPA